MITPGTYDIVIPQNATFSRTFQLKDGDGLPLNMTGYTVAAQVWTAGKAAKLADFTVAWVNRTAGSFTLSISAATTEAMGSPGYWDLLVTNPDGTKDYWLRGAATLETGYTE
ncbi:MAG: DUF7264 domain-containing protein [Fluviibacter sp.]